VDWKRRVSGSKLVLWRKLRIPTINGPEVQDFRVSRGVVAHSKDRSLSIKRAISLTFRSMTE